MMRNNFIFLNFLFVSTISMASVGKGHVFMCEVTAFDHKQVTLACDPKKPKDRMITPRDWVDKDTKIGVSSTIKLDLNDIQFEKWLAMNNSPMANTKEKK